MDWKKIHEVIREPLFSMGDTQISLLTILQVVLVGIGVALLVRFARKVLTDRVLARMSMDEGTRYAVARIAGYVVMVLGSLVGLTAIGIDLTSLTVIVGALGVGIGFGLQTIVNNFVCGLILLTERPFQVGDRIEVGGTEGRVVRIAARSTTILTNDNINLIIPNAEFITGRVVNWSLGGDRRVRIKTPLGVAYGSDVRLVERLLVEAADEDPDVLEQPAPVAILKGFGDSSIDFEMRVWTATLNERPNVLRSSLYFRALEKFNAHGVQIPFPQRDLHVKGPVRVELGGPAA